MTRYDDTHDRYYELTVNSVTDGSRPLQYTTSIQSDNEVIKIGDPNLLVTGANRYVITYHVLGAMNAFADHDELFWNVDGALWPVAKQEVSAAVQVSAATFVKVGCYQGPTGSTEPCESSTAGNSVTFSSTRPLGSSEQMSVVTALSGSSSQLSSTAPRPPSAWIPFTSSRGPPTPSTRCARRSGMTLVVRAGR